MDDVFRFGFIGWRGADSVLRALQTLEAEKKIRLTCAADETNTLEPEVGRHLASRGVKVYDDAHHLFEKEHDLHALIIAGGVPSHARLTATALARGLFVYLCPPPVPLIQQLTDLIALDSRQKVAVGFHQIHLPQIQQLKKWVVDGGLGAPWSIRVSASEPRFALYYEEYPWAGKMLLNKEAVFDGPLTNGFSGLLHAVMYLGASEMDETTVPNEVEGEFYRAMPIESYDMASVRGKLASGNSFHFIGSHATRDVMPFRIEISGPKGAAWYQEGVGSAENDCGLLGELRGKTDSAVDSLKMFVELMEGKRRQPAVRLEDVRGFLLATNGGMMGSGGVHSIPPEFLREYHEGHQFGYEVPDMASLMKRALGESKLFAEMNIPWGRKGVGVSVRSLRSLSLKDYISH